MLGRRGDWSLSAHERWLSLGQRARRKEWPGPLRLGVVAVRTENPEWSEFLCESIPSIQGADLINLQIKSAFLFLQSQ